MTTLLPGTKKLSGHLADLRSSMTRGTCGFYANEEFISIKTSETVFERFS